MYIETKKTVDMLTKDSVSILTQNFIEFEGKEQQVGENHRRAYTNSISGRAEIVETEPENVVNAVMAVWGDTATVAEEERDGDTYGNKNS